jgi:hypothetical protein
VFAGIGLFVLLLGLFPNLRPPRGAALPLVICLLALPALGLFKFLTGKARASTQTRTERASGTRTQVGLYALIMIGVGAGFFIWAKHLEVSSPVIFGSLLVIEGLGGMIVSLTEWWRLSHIGISSALMAGGFLLPFVDRAFVAVPVGGAFLLGSFASAAILYWQLLRRSSVTLGFAFALSLSGHSQTTTNSIYQFVHEQSERCYGRVRREVLALTMVGMVPDKVAGRTRIPTRTKSETRLVITRINLPKSQSGHRESPPAASRR